MWGSSAILEVQAAGRDEVMTMKRRIGLNPEYLDRIWRFIVAYIDENGISPSFDEVAKGVFMSRAQVVRYTDILEARGMIERRLNIPRSMRVLVRPPTADGRNSTRS